MSKVIEIVVENRLITGKRDINVFHHATGSAHIISHNSSITLPFKTVGENDYLQVSTARGAGDLWKACLIRLPSWADFEFSTGGNVTFVHLHDSNRILIKIPPGPPTWELKMACSTTVSAVGRFPLTLDYVIISDEKQFTDSRLKF